MDVKKRPLGSILFKERQERLSEHSRRRFFISSGFFKQA